MTNSATSQPLSRVQTDEESALLAELFRLMPDALTGVGYNGFRSAHKAWRPVLDQLVLERVIKLQQDHYYLTLPAIAFANNSESARFMNDADALYAEIVARYEADHQAPMLVGDLAETAGLADLRARQVLSYMFECNVWLQSQPPDILTNSSATIAARDGVLDFDNFRAVIQESDKWRVMSPYGAMQRDVTNMLEGALTSHQGTSVQAPAKIPPWASSLPLAIRDVMNEVYAAREINLRTLPAIGMRTALDLLFADVLAGDNGSFKSKVEEFRRRELITVTEEAHVLAAIEGGNASAHRGFVPDDEDLETMLEVTKRLLLAQYVLPAASDRLKANTPARGFAPSALPNPQTST